jgi:hypothetical protein
MQHDVDIVVREQILDVIVKSEEISLGLDSFIARNLKKRIYRMSETVTP